MSTKPSVFRGTRRVTISLVVAALAMSALAACGSSTESQADGNVSDPNNPVYFKWAEDPSAPSLVKIADELGYWDNAGIKPQYVGTIDSAQVPALLGKNEITFASFMFNRSLAAVAAGVDLKVIAAGSQTTQDEPHMEYFQRADSDYENPANLKKLEGKTIGLSSLKGCAEFIFKDYLTKNGVDLSQVKLLTQAESLLPQTLKQGDIEIAVVHPPRNGPLRVDSALDVAFSDFDNSQDVGGLAPITASGQFIRQYPAQTKEFVGILAKTANWVNANPDKEHELVQELTGVPSEQITKHYFVNNLLLDQQQTAFWWGLAERVGTLTPEEAKLKPEDIATNEYNPYAPAGPTLLVSQADNTKVLTDTER